MWNLHCLLIIIIMIASLWFACACVRHHTQYQEDEICCRLYYTHCNIVCISARSAWPACMRLLFSLDPSQALFFVTGHAISVRKNTGGIGETKKERRKGPRLPSGFLLSFFAPPISPYLPTCMTKNLPDKEQKKEGLRSVNLYIYLMPASSISFYCHFSVNQHVNRI